MYKLIALDIDGTLLNSEGEISESTKKILGKCQDHGIIVTISTGRPIQGVHYLIRTLNIVAPVITYNGAMIVDSITNEVLFTKNLDAIDAKVIIRLGIELDVNMAVWSNNNLYINKLNDLTEMYQQITGVDINLIDNYDSIIKNGITKVLWIENEMTINNHISYLDGKIGKGVNYCTSRPTFLEFFHNDISKAVSLGKVGDILSITKEETIAIGDGLNDLEMIEFAGIGVAMGNGHEKVKAIADYVTSSNDEDGIAKAIEKYVFDGV